MNGLHITIPERAYKRFFTVGMVILFNGSKADFASSIIRKLKDTNNPTLTTITNILNASFITRSSIVMKEALSQTPPEVSHPIEDAVIRSKCIAIQTPVNKIPSVSLNCFPEASVNP